MISFRRSVLLWLVVLPLLGAIVFINPLRETAMEDDWAYSRVVQHLLQTGTYKIDDWMAPNPIFQIYWGALLSKLMGYSFGTLRVSTLILVLGGLIAFYYLAKEQGLKSYTAGLVTLGLFASPLALRFSFNYMTDMPFVACSIIAMWLYLRAMRLHAYRWMLLASAAAAAAILVRQFGAALLVGLLCVWVLGKNRRTEAPFFSLGLILPGFATLLQIQLGSLTPNWATSYVIYYQKLYFSNFFTNPGPAILDSLWRLSMIFVYMAFFAMPFIGILLVGSINKLRDRAQPTEQRGSAGLNAGILIAGGLLVAIGYAVAVSRRAALMPFLFWYFSEIGFGYRLFITLISLIGAVIIIHILVFRYLTQVPLLNWSPDSLFLDSVALFFAFEIMAFFQLGDEYLLVLFPYFLLVMGRAVEPYLENPRYKLALTMFLFISLGLSSLWTRAALSESEALWNAAEIARARVPPREIDQGWIWNSYYGMFDDYLAAGDNRHNYDFNDYINNWAPSYTANAAYEVRESVPTGWEVVSDVPYQTFWLTTNHVYLLKRTD